MKVNSTVSAILAIFSTVTMAAPKSMASGPALAPTLTTAHELSSGADTPAYPNMTILDVDKNIQVQSRDDKPTLSCTSPGWFWTASSFHARVAIDAIRDRPGYVTIPQGPAGPDGPGARCLMVSCHKKSAIWACNDNGRDYKVLYRYIADIASRIVNECTGKWNGERGTVRGQYMFHRADKWNVIIAGGGCMQGAA